MGLFDKLTGTRRPSGEAVPRSPEEVRRALLEVNGPDVPYVVRPGAVDEAELVAEWRIRDPAWHTFFARVQASQVLLIRMRLVPERHEVRALDQQWDVT
ncbi:hypothetical protein ABZ845_04500 [Streptomyces sp. NPDC047022]|uniref:hypothetical protein n=1 Tax=Streptomyces sp. NPDC047022 TaxID=3155737 RepID=UPI003401F88C